MWQQFVRTDYMEIDVPENPKLKAIMGKDKEHYQKIQKEWKKIQANDMKLREKTKIYKKKKQERIQEEREKEY